MWSVDVACCGLLRSYECATQTVHYIGIKQNPCFAAPAHTTTPRTSTSISACHASHICTQRVLMRVQTCVPHDAARIYPHALWIGIWAALHSSLYIIPSHRSSTYEYMLHKLLNVIIENIHASDTNQMRGRCLVYHRSI